MGIPTERSVKNGINYIEGTCVICKRDFCWPESQIGYLGSGQYVCKPCEQERNQPVDVVNVVTPSVHTFASGAQSSGQLPPYHLVPTLALLDRVAPRFGEGAAKYGVNAWRKGLTDRTWLLDRANHGLAHFVRAIAKLSRGVPMNEGDDDLAAAIWALSVLAEAERVANVDHTAIDEAIAKLTQATRRDAAND